uniref:Sulfotransferase n=1 Tax=Kalanchoe fedtschenkoi TaxID=63787 RepID=A0A7N0R8E3_KALFE
MSSSLATLKSGATWLKALLFSIMNRSSHCSFRVGDGGNNNNPLAPSHLDDPTPEDQSSLLSTHLPHSLLPRSMIESGCKFVHVMREAQGCAS